MTLMHSIEPGSYLVHTDGDTGNCFLLVQLRLNDRRESIEALQLGHKSPSNHCWRRLRGTFGETGCVHVTVEEEENRTTVLDVHSVMM